MIKKRGNKYQQRRKDISAIIIFISIIIFFFLGRFLIGGIIGDIIGAVIGAVIGWGINKKINRKNVRKHRYKEPIERRRIRYGTKPLLCFLIFGLLIINFALLISASELQDTYPPMSYVHSPTVPRYGELKPDGAFKVDLFTGSATYSYSIKVPPGRNDLYPSLDLFYNSHSTIERPSFLGTGWTLSQSYIQRDVNYSSSETSDDKFKLILDGIEYELVYTGGSRYYTEIETFLYIEKKSGGNNEKNEYWIVKKQDGTAYRFGFNNNSEMVSNLYDYVWRWSLDLINDTHNNSIFYTYQENPYANDIGAVYPNTIRYNNDQKREVEFIFEALDRPDIRIVYEEGAKIRESRRLKEIVIKANNSLVRKYVLGYDMIDKLSFITNITQYGNDNSTNLPPVKFVYNEVNDVDKGWNYNSSWVLPDYMVWWSGGDVTDRGVRFIDVNRDGLIDFLVGRSSTKEVYINNGDGWTYDSSWTLPEAFVTGLGRDYGVRFGDVNGDGLIDIVRGHINGETVRKVYINNGTGWNYDSSWELLFEFVDWSGTKIADLGIRLVDANGDGYDDLLSSYSDREVYINNGSGWQLDSSWTLPVDFTCCVFEDYGVRFGDVNGDGLIDIVQGWGESGNIIEDVYINNGSGWTYDSSWTLPEVFIWRSGAMFIDMGARLADVNGDGLTDFLVGYSSTKEVYINNGSDWVYDSSWTLPEPFVSGIGMDYGTRLVDINGDGLVEVVRGHGDSSSLLGEDIIESTSTTIQEVNAGHSDTDSLDIDKKESKDTTKKEISKDSPGSNSLDKKADVKGERVVGLFMADSNSMDTIRREDSGHSTAIREEKARKDSPSTDVTTKEVVSDSPSKKIVSEGEDSPDAITRKVYIHKLSKPYLMKESINELEGSTSIDYQKSTYLDNTGTDSLSDLGFNLWVVSFIKEDNGMSGSHQHITNSTFNYADGMYDYGDKDFRGFNYVVENKADSIKTKHWFHQDDARKGHEYKTEIFDNQDKPYEKIEFTWNYTSQNNYYITLLIAEIDYDYDGTLINPKIKEIDYGYDNYGNIISKSYLGDITVGEDEKYEYYEYVYNTSNWIIDKEKHYILYDLDNSTKVRESWYRYDNLTYGQSPIKGDLTHEEDWLDIGMGQNPTTTYDYDNYGNIIKRVDAEGNAERYIYGVKDTTYTFIDEVLNAKNQSTNYTYDLGTGNILSNTDPNSYIVNYSYDVLGRISKEILPYDNSTYPTKKHEYEIDGVAPEKIKVMQRENSKQVGTLDKYYFYDGFGRVIQIKREAENNQQISINIYYDKVGRLYKIRNPYFTSDSGNYTAPQTVDEITYTYDPLDRITNVTNPDNTKRGIEYDHWVIEVYDENNNQKDYYLDAYEQTTKVVEHNNGSLYNTTYRCNPAGNLLEIKDEQGNVFNSTYDSLGRKTKLEDPDMGNWSYSYDKVGNLINRVDSRNVSVLMTYDELNRIINKTADGPQVLMIILYTYDQGTIGTLSQVTQTPNITINYAYDNHLRKISEIKTIDGTNFTLNWTFNAMDSVTSKTLPNGEVINYSYGEQGLVKSVGGIITNISYNEQHDPLRRVYANNLETNFTYDQENFRLVSIKTENIQGLNYEYDNAGNVKKINNTIRFRIDSMEYDDLDRLLSTQRVDNSPGPLKDEFTINFSYNSIGNMLEIIKGVETITFAYGQRPAHAPDNVSIYTPDSPIP